jgi:hypothetical protein
MAFEKKNNGALRSKSLFCFYIRSTNIKTKND